MLDQLKIILEDPILLKVTYALIWLIAIWIIGRLLKRLTNRLTKENPIKFQLRKGISFASYIAVFLLIMAIFEVNLSTPDITSNKFQYVLTDIGGRLLEGNEIKSTETIIPFHHLAKGVYFISLQLDQQTVKTFKIIKNN